MSKINVYVTVPVLQQVWKGAPVDFSDPWIPCSFTLTNPHRHITDKPEGLSPTFTYLLLPICLSAPRPMEPWPPGERQLNGSTTQIRRGAVAASSWGLLLAFQPPVGLPRWSWGLNLAPMQEGEVAGEGWKEGGRPWRRRYLSVNVPP